MGEFDKNYKDDNTYKGTKQKNKEITQKKKSIYNKDIIPLFQKCYEQNETYKEDAKKNTIVTKHYNDLLKNDNNAAFQIDKNFKGYVNIDDAWKLEQCKMDFFLQGYTVDHKMFHMINEPNETEEKKQLVYDINNNTFTSLNKPPKSCMKKERTVPEARLLDYNYDFERMEKTGTSTITSTSKTLQESVLYSYRCSSQSERLLEDANNLKELSQLLFLE